MIFCAISQVTTILSHLHTYKQPREADRGGARASRTSARRADLLKTRVYTHTRTYRHEGFVLLAPTRA